VVSAKDLAHNFGLALIGESVEVSHVAMSADSVVPGSLFIAVQGANSHGIDFLDTAIENGAVTVLTDLEHAQGVSVPVLIHPDPRQIAGRISASVLNEPARALQLYGVTGTNGKTSTASYLWEILQLVGVPAGLSASTGRYLTVDSVMPSGLTSPEVTELHELLEKMRLAKLEAAVIEVSAQAIIRNRIDAVNFQVVGFTNLSRDHLDDFGSMDNYLAAKARLFTSEFAQRGVVLLEDEYSRKLAGSARIQLVTVGLGRADWVYSISASGNFEIMGPLGQLKLKFPHGELMAKNFALAIVMAISGGVAVATLQLALAEFVFQVPGRLERISELSPAVFIDYAHTPQGVLEAVKQLKGEFSQLTLILGASGNRDIGKRKQMGISCELADLLIITDQHPRDEDPASIRRAISRGALSVLPAERVLEFADPKTALIEALKRTSAGGAILWCGPGNLKYREVAGVKLDFDARSLARELVENA
jgi:UDP-N-acetylmuramoyl-L-alanyl-D-glutamate--2,6-diaminopimelate ligase